MPDMQYVDSSSIESIGYDEDSCELHVRFLSGSYYVYHDVPRDVYDDMMYAPSKGSYLNRQIKGTYRFTKQ